MSKRSDELRGAFDAGIEAERRKVITWLRGPEAVHWAVTLGRQEPRQPAFIETCILVCGLVASRLEAEHHWRRFDMAMAVARLLERHGELPMLCPGGDGCPCGVRHFDPRILVPVREGTS